MQILKKRMDLDKIQHNVQEWRADMIKSKGFENRSVRKTKKMLKEGLLVLLKEKPISQITVIELCDSVDINRGTFYYHYDDIYDMLSTIEEEFFNEFYEIIIRDLESSLSKDEPYLILTNVFYFFDENAELCETLLGPNGDLAFIQRIKKIVDEKCSDIWRQTGFLLSSVEYELFNSFIINGYIGLLETWLKTGRKQTPEEMASFVVKIIIPAAANSLSLDA